MKRRVIPFFLFVVATALAMALVSQARESSVGFSSPRRQNGYRLVRVYDTRRPASYAPHPLANLPIVGRFFTAQTPPEYPGVLVDSDTWPMSFTMRSHMSDEYITKEFTCSGVSSTGVKHNFACEYATDTKGHPLLAVAFPPALPGNYEWIDVTVRDPAGRSATWRVTRFRRAVQDLKPPVKVVERTEVAGMAFEARAWHDAASNKICVELLTPQRPETTEDWQLNIDKVVREWRAEEPFLAPNRLNSASPKWYCVDRRKSDVIGTRLTDNPAPYGDRFVRVYGSMTLYDNLVETVRFDDLPVERFGKGYRLRLPRPVTKTSASGVRITLSKCTENPDRETVCWTRNTSPSGSGVVLTGSPLYKRHHKPIQVSVSLDYDLQDVGRSGSGPTGDFESIRIKGPAAGNVAITFRVYQSVQLQSRAIPPLTVPVGDSLLPDAHEPPNDADFPYPAE